MYYWETKKVLYISLYGRLKQLKSHKRYNCICFNIFVILTRVYHCKIIWLNRERLLDYSLPEICLVILILREQSSQTNVILQYKLLTSILSAVCSVIQQSQYVLHFYYTLYDEKYDCKITKHQTIFQLQYFVLLNNHQYNCNITKSFLNVDFYSLPHQYITLYLLNYLLSNDLIFINQLGVPIIKNSALPVLSPL